MESETNVSILTDDGRLFDAESFEALGRTTCVRKASGQIARTARMRWQEPRISLDDLLYFYDANVWHRRCVLVKSLLVGGLGWYLERDGKVVFDPVRGIRSRTTGPLSDLLKQPSPGAPYGFDHLICRLLIDFFAIGNGYLEVVRDRRGQIAELYHVPGRTMRRDAGLDGYWQVRDGRQTRFDSFGQSAGRNEMLHLFQYDPLGDYYGVPDWLAALGCMGLERTILEFNTRVFANNLMAHMAVVVEGGKLGSAARDALRSFLLDRAVGVANAGKVLLLEDERSDTRIRFEKLNLDTRDLLIVEAQRHLRDTVIAAHGVPPRVLGIVTAGQLGATGEVEGQLRTFRETVLRPGRRLLESLVGQIATELDPAAAVRFHEIDVTDLRADADFYARMIEQGVFTPEEVRSLLDAMG